MILMSIIFLKSLRLFPKGSELTEASCIYFGCSTSSGSVWENILKTILLGLSTS